MKLSHEDYSKIISEFQDDMELETEHRKGSSFYATGYFEITNENVDEISSIIGKDASDLVGTRIVAQGFWSEYDGCDWGDFYLEKKVETNIPEKVIVIPEHIEVTWCKI